VEKRLVYVYINQYLQKKQKEEQKILLAISEQIDDEVLSAVYSSIETMYTRINPFSFSFF